MVFKVIMLLIIYVLECLVYVELRKETQENIKIEYVKKRDKKGLEEIKKKINV